MSGYHSQKNLQALEDKHIDALPTLFASHITCIHSDVPSRFVLYGSRVRSSEESGRTLAACAAEFDRRKGCRDGEEHGVPNDADVPDVHVGHWQTEQPEESEARARKEQPSDEASEPCISNA